MALINENCERMARIRKGLRLYGLLKSHACLFLTFDWFDRGDIPLILEKMLSLAAGGGTWYVEGLVKAINRIKINPLDLDSLEKNRKRSFNRRTFPSVFVWLDRFEEGHRGEEFPPYDPRQDPRAKIMNFTLLQHILLY